MDFNSLKRYVGIRGYYIQKRTQENRQNIYSIFLSGSSEPIGVRKTLNLCRLFVDEHCHLRRRSGEKTKIEDKARSLGYDIVRARSRGLTLIYLYQDCLFGGHIATCLTDEEVHRVLERHQIKETLHDEYFKRPGL